MNVSPKLTCTWLTVCLGLHCSLLAWEARRNAPTFDELSYLVAGVCHWDAGRFELTRVSPPLVRSVAAVPVVLSRPVTDWSGLVDLPGPQADRDFAERFWLANSDRMFWYFSIARWACIPFSVLGGVICYLWARDLYGAASGLLATSLWCFCPNILAHAELVTADAGAAALGVAAGYSFWRWVNHPTWLGAFGTGVVLGLAELTKTTWIILFVLWPLLWATVRWREGVSAVCGQFAQLMILLAVAVWMLNLAYAFHGSFRPLGEFQFVSQALSGPEQPNDHRAFGNRFTGTWLGLMPVPLPKDYVKGIDIQKHDLESRHWSYLHGQWRQGGWWYYYLYGLAIKVPLGTWGLVLLALVWTLFQRGHAGIAKNEVLLLAPPLVILVFISAETGINHHLRYVLPIFPFAFIWISRVARPMELGKPAHCVAVAALLAWSVASSLAIFPHSISYFNELVGGPTRGHKHLLNSNLDWCQDLLFLKRWVDSHPEARPLILAYSFPQIASVAKIPYELPVVEQDAGGNTQARWRAGWYAISAGFLHSRNGRYRPFQQMQPVGRAGYSICIYYLAPTAAVEIREPIGHSGSQNVQQ